MSKLIAAYIANPTEANALRLRKYMKAHAMAACMATEAERAVLTSLGL